MSRPSRQPSAMSGRPQPQEIRRVPTVPTVPAGNQGGGKKQGVFRTREAGTTGVEISRAKGRGGTGRCRASSTCPVSRAFGRSPSNKTRSHAVSGRPQSPERERKVLTSMDGSNRNVDPGTDPDFWEIRNSLLPATPEMERAANLLNAAADMILADRDEEAVALIHQADITALFDVRQQACDAPPVFTVHRRRKVANLLPKVPKEQRAAPFASESPLGEAVFRRDGWRCRYCGCRVAMPLLRLPGGSLQSAAVDGQAPTGRHPLG